MDQHPEPDADEQLEQAQFDLLVHEALAVASNDPHGILGLVLEAPDWAAARRALEQRYEFTEVQATVVLDLQFGRVNVIDRQRFEQTRQELAARVTALEAGRSGP